MAEEVIYYAIVDDFSSRDAPAGVLRRIRREGSLRDESFGRDLEWKFSSLLYSAERGDTQYKFHQVTEEEAMRIVDRIRREAAASG